MNEKKLQAMIENGEGQRVEFKDYGLQPPRIAEVAGGLNVEIFGEKDTQTPPKRPPKNTPQKNPETPPRKEPKKTHHTNLQDTSPSTPQKNPEITPQKNSLKQRLLDVVRQEPKLSQTEMAERLGIGFETVKEYLSKLKKEGKIKRVGTKKYGQWKVL